MTDLLRAIWILDTHTSFTDCFFASPNWNLEKYDINCNHKQVPVVVAMIQYDQIRFCLNENNKWISFVCALLYIGNGCSSLRRWATVCTSHLLTLSKQFTVCVIVEWDCRNFGILFQILNELAQYRTWQ